MNFTSHSLRCALIWHNYTEIALCWNKAVISLNCWLLLQLPLSTGGQYNNQFLHFMNVFLILSSTYPRGCGSHPLRSKQAWSTDGQLTQVDCCSLHRLLLYCGFPLQDLHGHHWNENIVNLTKFSLLAALEVVKMTTSSAASDENVAKMTTFQFQWIGPNHSAKETKLYCISCIYFALPQWFMVGTEYFFSLSFFRWNRYVWIICMWYMNVDNYYWVLILLCPMVTSTLELGYKLISWINWLLHILCSLYYVHFANVCH